MWIRIVSIWSEEQGLENFVFVIVFVYFMDFVSGSCSNPGVYKSLNQYCFYTCLRTTFYIHFKIWLLLNFRKHREIAGKIFNWYGLDGRIAINLAEPDDICEEFDIFNNNFEWADYYRVLLAAVLSSRLSIFLCE